MKFRTTYLIALSLLAAGCSKQAVQEGNFPENRVIRVSTEVALLTKGSYTTDNISEFDLMVTDNTKSAYSFANTRFSKSASGEWVPDETRLWGGADDKVTVFAIAPCFKDRVTWTTMNFDGADSALLCEIEAEQGKESKISDYLYWVNSTNDDKTVEECLADDGKLKIRFTHMLSLVRVTFKLGTEFNNTEVSQSDIISEVVISGTKRSFWIDSKRNSDKLTAMVQPQAVASDVKPYNAEWHSAADKKGNCTSVYECILVPQTITAGDLKISFKAAGKAYEWIAPNNLTFFPDAVHALTLKVGKDVVIADGFSASAWGDGGSTDLETE